MCKEAQILEPGRPSTIEWDSLQVIACHADRLTEQHAFIHEGSPCLLRLSCFHKFLTRPAPLKIAGSKRRRRPCECGTRATEEKLIEAAYQLSSTSRLLSNGDLNVRISLDWQRNHCFLILGSPSPLL